MEERSSYIFETGAQSVDAQQIIYELHELFFQEGLRHDFFMHRIWFIRGFTIKYVAAARTSTYLASSGRQSCFYLYYGHNN